MASQNDDTIRMHLSEAATEYIEKEKGGYSMLTEILNSSSVERLKGILKSRYGTGLKVNFMMELSSIDATAQSPSHVGGDLRLLITSELTGEFLAEALIEDGAKLSADDQDSAVVLVKMVLEPAIQNWKRRHEDLTSSFQPVRTHDNVVSLRSHLGAPLESATSITHSEMPDSQQMLSTSAMLLLSRNPHLFPKITSEIHELTQRWASLPYAEIRSQVQSVQDLQSLGALTLVVDLLSLSPQEQKLAADFLLASQDSKTAASEPLLLFTASESLLTSDEMRAMILPELLKPLQKWMLEVDRLPGSQSLLRETLELFLEPEAMI